MRFLGRFSFSPASVSGDALGPIGFALGLEAALDACSDSEQGVPWGVWYLDDGTIAGSLEGVCDYFSQLVPALLKLGLQVNPNKCTLWGPGVQLEEDMNDRIPDTLPLSHPIRSALSLLWHMDHPRA